MSDIIQVSNNNDLTLGQIAMIEQLRNDPVSAAKVLLGVDLHWYQVEAIEDFFLNNKRFALLKWSRQLGKCSEFNSLILVKLQRFSYLQIEVKNVKIFKLYELINNDKDIKNVEILTLNQETNKFEWTSNFSINYNGKKKVYKIKTALGREVILTDNHPLRKLNNWIEVKDIKVKDKIAVPRIINAFGEECISDSDVKMIAYMIGDGCTRDMFCFTSDNSKNKAEFREMSFDIFGSINIAVIYTDKFHDYVIEDETINGSICFDKRFWTDRNNATPDCSINWCKKYNIWNKLSYDKSVPEQIIGTSKRQIALFLNRLFSTDGWASTNYHKPNEKVDKYERYSVDIGYCSVNKKLAKDVQHLLLRFGIIAKLSDKPVDYTRKDGSKTLAYQLHIGDRRSVLTFCDEIGIFGKEEAVAKCRELSLSKENNNNRDVIPIEIWEYIRKKVDEKLVIEKKLEKERIRNGVNIPRSERVSLRKWDRDGLIARKELMLSYPYAPQRDKVMRYAEFLNNDYLKSLADSDLYWDEVVSIEYVGEHDTYDLAVPGPDNGGRDGKYRNFICDDILVHNTFLEAIIVALQCILYPEEVGVFLAPSQRQSLNPMNTLLRCYNNSAILRSLVSKKTKGHMVFKNGSEITSLPMGDGSKVLGQHATIAGIDEYARFSQEYVTSVILPMLNQPGKNGLPNKLITLSTPLSKQNHFYNWYLTHKKHVKDANSIYHLSEFDYRDSPTIDLGIIQIAYENSSWEQFARENLGIFTDNIDGFFSNELIYQCVEEEDGSIKIQNVPAGDGRRYVLGVDPSNMVMQDRFAIYLYEVIEFDGGGLGLKFANAWTFDKDTTTNIENLIRRIMVVFPIMRCNIDAGGGGRQIAEHLMEAIEYHDDILGEDIKWTGCKNADVSDKTPQKGGNETPIKIIPYSTEKKNRMFFNLRNLMSKRLFKLPKNNLHDKAYIESNLLKDELENIITTTLPNNLLHYDHPGGIGDDRVNATALAVDAFWDSFYGQTQSTANIVRGIENKPLNLGLDSCLNSPRDFNYRSRELF